MSSARIRPLPGPGLNAAVAERVLVAIEPMTAALAEAYREVPEYAAMDRAILQGEVVPTSRRIVEGFFGPIAAGRDPDATRIPEVAEMGRRRLELGVPLEPILHVYRICGRVVWQAIVDATEPGEEGVLADLGARWMGYIDTAASLAAASYLAASHEMLRAVDARRRALLDALLSASDPAEVAAVSIRFSAVLAPAYVPVLIEGEHAAPRIDVVLAAAPQGTIGDHRSGRILLLVPASAVDVNVLSRAAGRAVVAWADPAAPGPALLAEVSHAETLLAAALASGVSSGAFGPESLLLEQLVAGNPRVTLALRRRVADALAGRDHDGLITSTLRTYLGCGSVSKTAEAEVVHPNTVLYRLNRVKALTGLDPRLPLDATLLVLAVCTLGATP